LPSIELDIKYDEEIKITDINKKLKIGLMNNEIVICNKFSATEIKIGDAKSKNCNLMTSLVKDLGSASKFFASNSKLIFNPKSAPEISAKMQITEMIIILKNKIYTMFQQHFDSHQRTRPLVRKRICLP
jgi:hypothetical protein